jgi:hypothetical protein
MTETQAREDLYERWYLGWYCEEITVRELIEPTILDKDGQQIYYQGCSYLGTTWRPKQKQS